MGGTIDIFVKIQILLLTNGLIQDTTYFFQDSRCDILNTHFAHYNVTLQG